MATSARDLFRFHFPQLVCYKANAHQHDERRPFLNITSFILRQDSHLKRFLTLKPAERDYFPLQSLCTSWRNTNRLSEILHLEIRNSDVASC
jgi:hypothetical protein